LSDVNTGVELKGQTRADIAGLRVTGKIGAGKAGVNASGSSEIKLDGAHISGVEEAVRLGDETRCEINGLKTEAVGCVYTLKATAALRQPVVS